MPIGTVYDPFIARGLDALIYSLYIGSRFILVGHAIRRDAGPGGRRPPVDHHALARHRAARAARLGAGLRPRGRRGACWRASAAASIRPTASRPTCGSPRGRGPVARRPGRARLGEDGWRGAVLAGGYRLLDAAEATEPLPPGAPWSRRRRGRGRARGRRGGPHRSSARRSPRTWSSSPPPTGSRRSCTAAGSRPCARPAGDVGHLETLFPQGQRRAPIVTVARWRVARARLPGRRFGAPVVPLGVDRFGQSGTIADLYAYAGIDPTTSSKPRSSRWTWRQTEDGGRHHGHADRGAKDVPA